jgi:hypothetical protein
MARLPENEGWRWVGEIRFAGREGHARKGRYPDAPPPVAFSLYAACDPRDGDCFYVGSAATVGRLKEDWRVRQRKGSRAEHHEAKRGPRIFAECGYFLLYEKVGRCHDDPGGPTKAALEAEEAEWLARMDAAGPHLLDNVFGMTAVRAARGLDQRGREMRDGAERVRTATVSSIPVPPPGPWPSWARRHGWRLLGSFDADSFEVEQWPETPHGYTYAMVNAATGEVIYVGHAGDTRCGRFRSWHRSWLNGASVRNPSVRDSHRAAFAALSLLYVRPAQQIQHMGQTVTDMQLTETAAIQRWNPKLVRRREGATRSSTKWQ